eukprot:scaffold542_cov103-Skeletonema_marinoi.AAC.2
MVLCTSSQHHSITASQHHSITASQHHSITASEISENNVMISHEQCKEVDFTSSYDGLGRRCSHVSLLFSIHSAAT